MTRAATLAFVVLAACSTPTPSPTPTPAHKTDARVSSPSIMDAPSNLPSSSPSAAPALSGPDRTFTVTPVGKDGEGGHVSASMSRHAVSSDGRYLAFASGNSLAAGDGDSEGDVYVADLLDGSTSFASPGVGDEGGRWSAIMPVLSGSGRTVAFTVHRQSQPEREGGVVREYFVFDLESPKAVRVLEEPPSGLTLDEDRLALSEDGRKVMYGSPGPFPAAGISNSGNEVFVWSRDTGDRELATVTTDGARPNGFVRRPQMTSDGRLVFFESNATNFVRGDTADWDVFVRDLGKDTTAVVLSSGTTADRGHEMTISPDGRYVAYDLVRAFIHLDRRNGTRKNLPAPKGNAYHFPPSISGGGRYVAYITGPANRPGNTCMSGAVYVTDVRDGSIQKLHRMGACDDSYAELHVSFSANGRTLGFGGGRVLAVRFADQ